MTNKHEFDATAHFGDSFVGRYDDKIRKVIRGYAEMHDLSYYLLKDQLPENAKILVSGIGTAYEAVIYGKNQPGWRIFGVDPTPEMVESARSRIAQSGLTDSIQVTEGFIEHIAENDFNAATSILVMQFIKDNGDKETYLRSLSEKLQTGAKLVLIDLEGEKGSAEFNLLLSAWKKHQYSTREDLEQIDKDFEHIDADLQVIPQKRLVELLQSAGFHKVCKFYQSYLFGGYFAEKA